jgi:DHA1 family multidrug resistance protein-like MFS transporter
MPPSRLLVPIPTANTTDSLNAIAMAAELVNPEGQSSAATSRWSVDIPPHVESDTPQKSLEDMGTSDDALADVEKAVTGDAPGQSGEKNYLVEFDGPDDPGNPKNWTQKKRWAITVCMGLLVFTVTFASSIFSVNIRVVQEKFDVTMVTATLGVALFVLVSSSTLAPDTRKLT